MTIFGDNHNASDPRATLNCNFALHDATEVDRAMNIVFAVLFLITALFSILGNISVFIYYGKIHSAPFSEFVTRQYITIVRAFADLIYSTRTIYVAYILLSSHHEELCSCPESETIFDVYNTLMYTMFMVSVILTFVISVLNYVNIIGFTLNMMIYSVRNRARVVFFIMTLLLFVVVFILETLSTTGLDFDKTKYVWFSPIQQVVFNPDDNAINFDVQKWLLFASKGLLLFFHVLFGVIGVVNLLKLENIRIRNIRRICLSMVLLIFGNCLCLTLSLAKDLLTDFIDFASSFDGKDVAAPLPYNMTYILFVSDVLLPSLISVYNPVVFIVNSKSVQRTVIRAITETVVFTVVSVSRKHTIQRAGTGDPEISAICAHDPDQAAQPASVVHNRTISITIFTSADVHEPVSGENIRLPLNHIPSKPTMSIPVRQLLNPMTLPCIGVGFFCKVYKFTDHVIGCSVAMKHIHIITEGAKSTVEDVKKEVNINSELQSHANIVQYVGCIGLEHSSWYIIQEYMLFGSLKSKLVNMSRSQSDADYGVHPVLPENMIIQFSREMAAGLVYLHQHDIVHRDLRSANVLISSTNTAKLADFGLSKKLEAVSRAAGDYTPNIGNPYWRSAEIMNNEECGPPADIWSFGITVLEMIYNEPPFMKFETYQYMWKLARQKKVPEIPVFVSIEIQQLLGRCLKYDPTDRPLASELFE